MTRRQIEASRERRLWISQIIIPSLTLTVSTMAIPEVRELVKTKATELKRKIEDRMKK